MRVLYLGYVWPEPASSAAGGRTLEILRCLRDRAWSVSYASAAALSTHRFPLDQLGIEECPIAVNDDAFDELLLKLQPDLVFFDRFFTEEQFAWRVEKHCPQAVRVLDTCDLHS
ncbi:MAG: glycosyltransferase, partial [Burkholderiaceae bacterium]